ncbi:MAG: NAD(P)-dependent alcohol dehydrogenase [Akkermansiaceae bacterium]|nr:NAD(P)-dependent alcohol dehydrogenase [Akkermansiaceae bacterium]NNM28050.1 NAD(P)-dependent alcohol dehydrogenase [Akkermansiaceae bacterium]
MSETVHAWAATEARGELTPFEYELGDLGPDEIDIRISHCGICHSDLSMLDNAWELTEYPLVPGHEVVGTIAAVGEQVSHLAPGQRVGLGWYSRSCLTCRECLRGDHNLCADAEGVIVGRHGGFADLVRAQSTWATPLPDGIDPAAAGPLFCGGITVFNPIVQTGTAPTDRVAVVGIGGLGHLALQFLRAWGCEVTAFSHSPEKEAEARSMGAHHFVATHDEAGLERLAGSFDLILVTVNVPLNWPLYVNALRPKGRLHLVGAAPEVSSPVFPLLSGQRSISGSPLGSPATTLDMLEFCARHAIAPMIETFALAEVNAAMEHLRAGKPRYRIVLEA